MALFKRSHIYTIDEIQAMSMAYGYKLKRVEMTEKLGIPFLVGAGFTYFLTYYIWVALASGITCIIYARIVIFPQAVEKSYQEKAFMERNKFVNSMAMILTDSSITILSALQRVKNWMKGEYKRDLINLINAIQLAGTEEETVTAFYEFEKKYEKDSIHGQFVNQLSTAQIEGRMDAETFQDIADYHNLALKKRRALKRIRKAASTSMKWMGVLLFLVIMAMTFCFGYDTFYHSFARNIIGWAGSIVWLGLISLFTMQYFSRIRREEVTEADLR